MNVIIQVINIASDFCADVNHLVKRVDNKNAQVTLVQTIYPICKIRILLYNALEADLVE